MKRARTAPFLCLLTSFSVHASFIESTMGAAVVNDATATYFNPAALTRLSKAQIIALGSLATANTTFTGASTQVVTGFTQSGDAREKTHYYLPTLYLGMPASDKVTFGLALISNSFSSNIEDNSILRYMQPNKSIQGNDLVPAMGVRINEFFSLGVGLSLSEAHFVSLPVSGFPSLNIPDSQSRNESRGTGIGGDVGVLYKPSDTTYIGFNYRSAITYRLNGTSVIETNPGLVSPLYSFVFWTPARSVLSVNHFISPKLGFIGTLQRIQWSIFKEGYIRGVATQAGAQAHILNAAVPYHWRDSWLVTGGAHYRMTQKWKIRAASTYIQSPGNPHYQIVNGDSIVAGGSMSYAFSDKITLDGSYAHSFGRGAHIEVAAGRNLIQGTNKHSLDAVSLKITYSPV